MNENLIQICLCLILTCGFAFLCYWLYSFQKSFSNKMKPSWLLISLLFILSTIVLSLFVFVLFDIFIDRKNFQEFAVTQLKPMKTNIKNSSSNSSFLETSYTIHKRHVKEEIYETERDFSVPEEITTRNYILLSYNILVYLILPFLFFYNLEYLTLLPFNKKTEESIDLIEKDSVAGINSEVDCENSLINVYKNYFYYLIGLFSLNICYYVNYILHQNNHYTNLIKYSTIPSNIRNISQINSTIEVINLYNFQVLLFIGKIFGMIYTPYGLATLVSKLIDSFKQPMKVKYEYKSLNANMAQNYQLIKRLTQEKIMVGIPLTKKEKEALKEAKANIEILDHKQEFLDEKTSLYETLKLYLLTPIKFILTFLLFLSIVVLLISKTVVIVNLLTNYICSGECGFITSNLKTGYSLQDLFYNANSDEIGTTISSKIVYLITGPPRYFIVLAIIIFSLLILAAIEGVKFIGFYIVTPFEICNYNIIEIKKCNMLSFMFYTTVFLCSLSVFYDILNLFPDVINFGINYSKCNLLISGISGFCDINQTGKLLLKSRINFPFTTQIFIFIDIVSVVIISILCIYYPVKSIFNLRNLNYNTNDKMSTEEKEELIK